jgi:glycerol uptake facilitator-like aquaporin
MASAEAISGSLSIGRRVAAETLGTSMLLAAVVGSGIMAETLTDDVALQLLCNTLATGAILFVIIILFAPISGAHFNPAVTLISVLERSTPPWIGFVYLIAQLIGAIVGVWLAHGMFGEVIFTLGVKSRAGLSLWLSEIVATFGLVLTITGAGSRSRESTAASVALYIVAAYWFTASTSFANPAVTIARSFTPTFSGIAPWDVPAFIMAQFCGATAAWLCSRTLFRTGRGK